MGNNLTPNKQSQGHIGKSFEFSVEESNDLDESQDKVGKLPLTQTTE